MSENKNEGGRRTEIRPRSAARLAAVQAIYEMELADRGADAVLRDFSDRRWNLLAADRTALESVSKMDPHTVFLGELVRGVAERNADIEGMISPALSPEWPLERLEAVLPTASSASVVLRTSSGSSAISATPPALSVTGP